MEDGTRYVEDEADGVSIWSALKRLELRLFNYAHQTTFLVVIVWAFASTSLRCHLLLLLLDNSERVCPSLGILADTVVLCHASVIVIVVSRIALSVFVLIVSADETVDPPLVLLLLVLLLSVLMST